MNKYLKIGVPVVGVLIFLIFLSPLTLIGAGHRGVATEFGKVQETVLNEGFHFINPIWRIRKFDVRTQKVETESEAASKDLQSVHTTIAINFSVKPDTVHLLFQETSGMYEVTLISPAIQEAVKAATSKFTADELITKRSEVKEMMREELAKRESMRFFRIEDVNIIDFKFSKSFNASIEKKVTAEQDALAAKNKLEQTRYEAEQKIVAATAEAESIRIQSQALSNNAALVELEAVRKWNGILPQYMMGDTIPFINLK